MNKSVTRRRVTGDDWAKAPRRSEKNVCTGMQTSESTIPWRIPARVYGFGYLISGTTLAVLGQLVTNQGATDPSTQLIAWTKYFCTFALSLIIQVVSSRVVPVNGSSASGGAAAGQSPSPTAPLHTVSTSATTTAGTSAGTSAGGATDVNARKASLLTAAVGLLDTLSYGLNCLGFALCGSALSMVVFAASGQVFTAIARRILLHKTMTAGQVAGVGLVVLGLVVRSAGKIKEALAALTAAAGRLEAGVGEGATASRAAAAAAVTISQAVTDRELALGAALIVLSALGYSLLGCLYEQLSAIRGPAMSHAQVATSTSFIGLLATSAYQVLYTRPRWQELVANRMVQRGLGWWPVVRLYGVFGALFTVHGLVQGIVLQRSGATAVGIISAMRASAVALVSGALFCGPRAPHQCLTPASTASASIVTAGALLWTLTGPRKSIPPSPPAAPPTPPPSAVDGLGCQGCEDALDHKYGKHH